MSTVASTPAARGTSAGLVLLTLASGQFLMTLDSSVMNVSIATVAKDVGTTVTGIQGAITAYTLVMAALMITGGKIASHPAFVRFGPRVSEEGGSDVPATWAAGGST